MIGNNRLELVLGGEKMTVDIEAPGVVEFDSETVEVNSPAYTRIGIRLKKPLQSGSVRLIMYPSRPQLCIKQSVRLIYVQRTQKKGMLQ